LELTERVDFGSAQTVVEWLDKTYGSEAPGGGGTKIALPPITDVPPPLRTLYVVFTTAHVWLDALMVDRKTEAFKFGVSIDFTQTPVDATQLTQANKALDDEAAKTGKQGKELEDAKTELKGGAEAKEAEDKITKAATTGGWDVFNGIKIKGIGVMFERSPKPEPIASVVATTGK
jgi:hypothetical protein